MRAILTGIGGLTLATGGVGFLPTSLPPRLSLRHVSGARSSVSDNHERAIIMNAAGGGGDSSSSSSIRSQAGGGDTLLTRKGLLQVQQFVDRVLVEYRALGSLDSTTAVSPTGVLFSQQQTAVSQLEENPNTQHFRYSSTSTSTSTEMWQSGQYMHARPRQGKHCRWSCISSDNRVYHENIFLLSVHPSFTCMPCI